MFSTIGVQKAFLNGCSLEHFHEEPSTVKLEAALDDSSSTALSLKGEEMGKLEVENCKLKTR